MSLRPRAALTLLTNENGVLPSRERRLWVDGLVTSRSTAATLAEADLAVVRLRAPYDARPGKFESMFHAGSLEFAEDTIAHVRALAQQLPTVVVLYLDRPAIVTSLIEVAHAVVVDFGADDEAILDVITGAAEPHGALPFDLPRSMAAVVESPSDSPFSTRDPIFRFGHGLRY